MRKKRSYATIPTALARRANARWMQTLEPMMEMPLLSGPSTTKPKEGEVVLKSNTVSLDPRDHFESGIVLNESEFGTIYYLKFKFDYRDIAERPLETALQFQEEILKHFKGIKSNWIPNREARNANPRCECGWFTHCVGYSNAATICKNKPENQESSLK